jgi:hypothetical protein
MVRTEAALRVPLARAWASELDATQRCATMKSVAIHIVPIHIVAMAAALLARTGHFVAEIQGGE